MSKGLEALKTIRHIHDIECGKDESINKDFDIIEKELKKLEEIDYILKDSGLTFDDLQKVCFAYTVLKMGGVDKKLKALEIIKEKIFNGKDELVVLGNIQLTQEEFDLLKEVLR